MPDPNAKERAAQRWVDLMLPAAAMGVPCRKCDALIGEFCVGSGDMRPHESRLVATRNELHALALILFDLG